MFSKINKLDKRGGFTLLEILLVVAIIAILAGIVIVAINPAKQLGDARNAQRKADVATILSAVYQYVIDHNGTFPTDINGVTTQYTTGSTTCQTIIATANNEICKSNTTDCGGADTGTDLGTYLSGSTPGTSYVTSMPTDPSEDNTTDFTGYFIARLSTNGSTAGNGRIIVCSQHTENMASSTTLDGPINASR
jgi:prepilin-type N-terminal cleavage/methylation domain-containing protein